jgi:hypothetical protein
MNLRTGLLLALFSALATYAILSNKSHQSHQPTPTAQVAQIQNNNSEDVDDSKEDTNSVRYKQFHSLIDDLENWHILGRANIEPYGANTLIVSREIEFKEHHRKAIVRFIYDSTLQISVDGRPLDYNELRLIIDYDCDSNKLISSGSLLMLNGDPLFQAPLTHEEVMDKDSIHHLVKSFLCSIEQI